MYIYIYTSIHVGDMIYQDCGKSLSMEAIIGTYLLTYIKDLTALSILLPFSLHTYTYIHTYIHICKCI